MNYNCTKYLARNKTAKSDVDILRVSHTEQWETSLNCTEYIHMTSKWMISPFWLSTWKFRFHLSKIHCIYINILIRAWCCKQASKLSVLLQKVSVCFDLSMAFFLGSMWSQYLTLYDSMQPICLSKSNIQRWWCQHVQLFTGLKHQTHQHNLQSRQIH